MKKTIFWFRQDLRTFDNIGLIEAIKNSDEILPIFILDKNIIDSFGGLNDKKFGFIRESLEKLDKEIKYLSGVGLKVFYDFPERIILFLIEKYKINQIYVNETYSRYGINRDQKLKELLLDKKVIFKSFLDFLLISPYKIPQKKVFTPFFKLWEKALPEIYLEKPLKFKQLEIQENHNISDFIKIEKHPYFTMDFGIYRFNNFITRDYDVYRNDLDKDATSKLSPYIRFGIFSIREIYKKAKEINHHFVQELAWREFWHHIRYYFPETKTIEFQETKRNIKWRKDEYLFDKWCKGETGYPIVDACMKQLLETNWMHGRCRMIVASFLTKDLLIDWRLGEEFFKKHLLDYDEALNFGNWQWAASVGADPKPLRIFNPVLQSKKFDSEAKFIKKYIPSLSSELASVIHDPINNLLGYQKIIINHNEAQKEAKKRYSESREIFEFKNKKE